jgi:gliding motility-associated-like protein
MKIIKYGFCIFCVLLASSVFSQTGFVNNGANISIGQGICVNAYDFTNNQTSGTDGIIDLDGIFIINGNITNNSNGNLFTNIETVPDGNVLLLGNNQAIQGTSPIFFENLFAKNPTKTLNVNNCEIKGILSLDGVIDLNKNRLILDINNQSAINYSSGYIKSETEPLNGLGELEWRIGSNVGTYNVPFGTGSGTNDLNLTLKINSAASNDGSVIFATYPTDAQNHPYPDIVTSLDTFQAKDLADRFWKIEPTFSSKPGISLTFKYTAEDVDQSDNPQMILANMKAIRYNDLLGSWTDMKMTGVCDLVNNTVITDNITADNYYTYWTLSEFEFKIPNAFTPDHDGKNDFFLAGYQVKIINRWGQSLYEGSNGWDGTVDGKTVAPGTYYYIATVPDLDKNSKTVTGVITVVLNKN